MTLPSIEIDTLPLLDTAVGLFGSLVGESASGERRCSKSPSPSR